MKLGDGHNSREATSKARAGGGESSTRINEVQKQIYIIFKMSLYLTVNQQVTWITSTPCGAR